MKKAVICCINSKYIHSSLAPWCLFSGIKAYSKSVVPKVIEGTINEDINAIKDRVVSEKPDILGLCCYIWNISMVKALVNLIKEENKNIKIILGGPEVSYNQSEVLENSNIDFVISGEGEKPIAFLCDRIAEKGSFDIEGVSYINNGRKIIKEPFIDCDTPVDPYSKEYFDNLKGRIAYIEASRGCPYSCAFCLSGRCGKARFFDFERVKKNILSLANSGTKTIKFVDRTFNANHKRCNDIISFILAQYGNQIPKEVCFHFEIAGDIVRQDTIELLSKAPKGLFQLEIGMQSFNEKTLQYINRKTDCEKLKANINKLIALDNMHIHIDLIIGLPFEDINSFKNSFNIAFDLKSNMLQVGFLKLLYGADMRENTQKYPCEYSKEPPYEILSNEWLSNVEINKLHLFEDTFERLQNSGRFDNTVDYLLDVSGLNAFDFFMDFAVQFENKTLSNISLDDYSALIYDYFSKKDYCNESILRDKMVLDRFLSVKGAFIPEFLRVNDSNLKKVKNIINQRFELKPNNKRAVAILYSTKCAIFADYENTHSNLFYGKYKVTEIDLKNYNI